MSEQTSNPTSGQNVPKSKFRRKSRQEQTAASKLRMERRGEKLDAAREKLAKQKPPKKPEFSDYSYRFERLAKDKKLLGCILYEIHF